MADKVFSQTSRDFIQIANEVLRLQVEVLFPHEYKTLTEIGIADTPGRFLDIGCGNACHLMEMAKKYPAVSFTGIDANSALIEKARENLKQWPDIKNIALECGSMFDYAPQQPFDIVHTRYVLQHMPSKVKDYLGKVRTLLRDGGRLLIRDSDEELMIIHPPYPPVVKIREALCDLAKKKNEDRFIARKLPRALRDAGFTEIRFAGNYITNLEVGNELTLSLLKNIGALLHCVDSHCYGEEDLAAFDATIEEIKKTGDFVFLFPEVTVTGIKSGHTG